MAHHPHTHHAMKMRGHADHAEKLARLHRATGGRAASDEQQDKKMITKAVHEHEAHDHPGTSETKLKLKDGGHVTGHKARHRLDRPHRAAGGRTKKGSHTVVNVVVPHGGDRPMPMAAPGGGAPIAPPAVAPPPRPPMMPPGMGGGPPTPPGGPGMPMMRKRGGRVGEDAGAGSGLGRLEKIKDYGKSLRTHAEDEPFTGHDEDKPARDKGAHIQ